jgi:hypothetical protein
MSTRPLPVIAAATLSLAILAAAPPRAADRAAFWPPWISIESPVNPFDPSTRDAAFLVHAMMRGTTPQLSDLTASAEGIVDRVRHTVSVELEATSQPGTFAVRRQWPTDGAWLVVVTLARSTTAIVTLDAAGGVASVRVPRQPGDPRLPRVPTAAEIDSTLAAIGAASRSLAAH